MPSLSVSCGDHIAVNTADTTAFRQTAAFAAGKVLAYAVLGAAAGLMGEILLDVIEGNLGHCLIGGDAVAGGFGFDRVWCCDTS
ncbi:MAG: hypothetical protein COB46_03495 [Rhodospirillaceae bacterium]|nr:MAG: hypothetical protein COB46_03495 [Rhodospirillaceae bacterium]